MTIKRLAKLFFCFCMAVLPTAAQQPISVALQTPAPPQAQVSAAVIGNSGGSRYTYWVVTNYPSGSVVSGPANVSFAPGVLTSTNYVGVSWTGQSGASSYDLIRLNPPASFGGSCVACAVITATTATSFSDNGGSLANYSSGSGAVSANGTIYINTRDYSAPQMRQIVNGADSAIGSGGGVGPVGPAGPPGTAATIAAGTATGLATGLPPTVSNSGSSSAAVFNFGIPAGAAGASAALLTTTLNNTASHTLSASDAQVYTALTGTTAPTIVLPLVPPYPFMAIYGNCTNQTMTIDAATNTAVYFNNGTTASTNITILAKPPGCVDIRISVANTAQSNYVITELGNLSKWSCQPGLGDGLNAIVVGGSPYLESTCYNDQSVTITLTGIKCFSDNNGSSTMAVTNGAGTSLITGTLTCSNSFASGTQSATVTIAAADYLKFSFVSDGTSKQLGGVVTGQR